MESQIDKLGKVAFTIEKGYWSADKDYNKLTVVEVEGEYKTYASRKPVPAGTSLTNRDYWIPFTNLAEEITLDYQEFIKKYAGDLEESVSIYNELQETLSKVYTLLNKGVVVKGDKDCFEARTSTDVTITFKTVNQESANFEMLINGQHYNDYTGSEVQVTINVTTDTDILIKCTQNGIPFTGGWKIAQIVPCYLGASNNLNEVIEQTDKKLPISLDITGTYNVTCGNGSYIFLCVPKGFAVARLAMNGITIPCNKIEAITDDYIYTVYQSENTYQEGTYAVTIYQKDQKEEEVDNRLDNLEGVVDEATEEISTLKTNVDSIKTSVDSYSFYEDLLEGFVHGASIETEDLALWGETMGEDVRKLSDGEYTKKDDFKTINGNSIIGSGDITVTGEGSLDLSNYVTNSALSTKLNDYATSTSVTSAINNLESSVNQNTQEKLVSGTNIKTINGTSILGSGNISISTGGESVDLSNYVTNDSLSTTLASYVTESSLTTTLGNYVTISSIDTRIGDYINHTINTNIDSWWSNKTARTSVSEADIAITPNRVTLNTLNIPMLTAQQIQDIETPNLGEIVFNTSSNVIMIYTDDNWLNCDGTPLFQV